MYICIFEDNQSENFLPLAYLRPVYELRSGVLSLRQKIERLFPKSRVVCHVRPEVADAFREEHPALPVNTFPTEDCWFVNGRLIANDRLRKCVLKQPSQSTVFTSDGEVAVAYVRQDHLSRIVRRFSGDLVDKEVFKDLPEKPYGERLISFPWELIHRTPEEILNDFARGTRKKVDRTVYIQGGAHLLNKSNIVLGAGTVIKPGAVLDAEQGPIVIGKGVVVMSNAVIQGPAFIGDESVIKVGARIYHGTSIGTKCKIGGEVEMSLIQSFSNKQHDGYLGHSYLGSWVNIGADTNTSDLKNTYGTVKVDVGNRVIDSGVQFLGLLMGDHAKTGINVMFNAGTVVGVSCNIFGSGLPLKFIPSFSWGGEESYSEYSLEKSVETARKMMLRRNTVLSKAQERLLASVFAQTRDDRNKLGIR